MCYREVTAPICNSLSVAECRIHAIKPHLPAEMPQAEKLDLQKASVFSDQSHTVQLSHMQHLLSNSQEHSADLTNQLTGLEKQLSDMKKELGFYSDGMSP